MPIIPMRDLKNTAKIEQLCAETDGPVFITKNGYGRLVVMDIDYYERNLGKIREAALVNKGIRDYEEGRVENGPQTMAALKEKRHHAR